MFSTLPHSILCCNHFYLGDILRVLFVVNFRDHVMFLVKHVTMQFINYNIQQILHLRHFILIVIMFEYIQIIKD